MPEPSRIVQLGGPMVERLQQYERFKAASETLETMLAANRDRVLLRSVRFPEFPRGRTVCQVEEVTNGATRQLNLL